MSPTLRAGQDIISFNWAYLGRKPKIGDIVVVKIKGREIVKRVTKVLDREKMILVNGDNGGESTDSRHFGSVNLNQVVGKVIYQSNEISCPICSNCGFKLTCCGEP